jgi:hypothetical protein
MNSSIDVDAIKSKVDSLLCNVDPDWKIINVHSLKDYDSMSFNRKTYFGKSMFEYNLKIWAYSTMTSKPLSHITQAVRTYMHYTTLAKVMGCIGLVPFVDFGDCSNKVYSVESNRSHVLSSIFYALLFSFYEDSERATKEMDFLSLVTWIVTKVVDENEPILALTNPLHHLSEPSYQMVLKKYFQKKFQKDPNITTLQIADNCFEVTVYHHNHQSIGYSHGCHEDIVIEEACLKACKYLHLVHEV